MNSFVRGISIALVAVAALYQMQLEALSAELKKLRVAYVPITDVMPAYVAKDQGIFEENGLDVELVLVANQSVVVSSLVSGSADIGFSVALTALQAKEAGIDVAVVAGSVAFPLPAYAGVLVKTGSGIHTAKDLIGKKIAVASLKSFNHAMTIHWLEQNDVEENQVTFVEVPFPQLSDVLSSGQVDAVVTADPFYARIIEKKIGYQFDDYLASVPAGTTSNFYMTMRDWASSHQPELLAFRKSLDAATEFIKTNESVARDSIGRWAKQPPEVVAKMKIPVFSTAMGPDQFTFWIDVAKKQKLLTSDIKAEDILP